MSLFEMAMIITVSIMSYILLPDLIMMGLKKINSMTDRKTNDGPTQTFTIDNSEQNSYDFTARTRFERGEVVQCSMYGRTHIGMLDQRVSQYDDADTIVVIEEVIASKDSKWELSRQQQMAVPLRYIHRLGNGQKETYFHIHRELKVEEKCCI